jgi:signal transduction histidine kinase
MSESDLRAAYADALWAYVAEANEEGLARGRKLGEISLRAGLDSSEIAIVHFEALRAGALLDNLSDELLDERASRFLTEALRPFSNARRLLEQMSRELAEMNDVLIERTRELEISNTELEAFSYSISHDLRTSLKGARGMNELVDDLLELAQANRLPLELEAVDLDLLAREAIGELEPQLADSNADLVIGKLPVVDADRVLLKRVFVNLISNAIKFSRGAEPRARVEVGSSQLDRAPVLFVRDNGVGFDMDQSGRLFQAFERLHGGGDFEGTGVGLALVARIVERHGGRIWAESEPGKGASFFFTVAGEEPDVAASSGGSSARRKREKTASDR